MVRIVFAIALGASLLACGSLRLAAERTRVGAGVLFPLTPGRVWVYTVRDFQGRVTEFRARVNRELAEAEGTLTLVEESGGIPGDPRFRSTDVVAYYSRAGFVFRAPFAGGDQPAIAGAEPILPVDIEKRPSWQGSHSVLDVEGPPLYQVRTDSRIAAADETVAVRAGTFASCLRVETIVVATVPESPTKREIVHHYTDWYAPGVGLVKMRSAVDAEGRQRELVTLELASFDD